MPSITIGVAELPRGAEAVDACIAKALAGGRRGDKLGCGEQGCAYKLVEEPTHVIKVSAFDKPKDAAKWRAEACLGADLGVLGIGPRIHSVFECRSHGYIVMDMLRDARKLADGTVIRVKTPTVAADGSEDTATTDHLSRMPRDVQAGFVDVLARMIAAGYIHMDNHLENLGFIGARPIAFDFGFTQRREWGGPRDRLWALAFSLFQVLEHCPTEEMVGSLLWRVATAVMRAGLRGEELAWDVPALIAAGAAEGYASIAELAVDFPPLREGASAAEGRAQMARFKASAIEMADSPANLDVYVGCMCYAVVMQAPTVRARYDVDPAYEVLYAIRQGAWRA